MKTDKITIVGGGSAGWMTAATLIRAFPEKDITVIESSDTPTVGVGESTLGGIRRWTRFIGLDESSFFPETDASVKMSIKFTDFYKKDFGSFQYPFGFPYVNEEENPFYYWHLKKYFYPETDINDFTQSIFPASSLYENNKFSLNRNREFDNFDPGNDVAYHFDAAKFGKWLKDKYCIPRGIKYIDGTVIDISCNSEGIKYLVLQNDKKIFSDLFIDCTGFKSILLEKALNEPFISYSDMLPNNRAWATRIKYKNRTKELEGFTNSTAIENGWCWNIPLWSRLGAGYVYSDKFVEPEKAKEEFKKYLCSNKMVIPRTEKELENLEFKDIRIKVGIHERTFVKNVVAIGLSAGFIEPLESNGLFSVHEFLFKLVDILQRGSISQFDRDMYNVSVKDQFDGFAKFVALHYALSHRDDTEYWKSIQKKSFKDPNGEPYFPYLGRSDAFYNMIWRYMEEWGHPYSNAGITYISTGMNIRMMNENRIMTMQYGRDVDLKKETDRIIEIWKKKKSQWENFSRESPTIEEFLYENFYKKTM